MDKLVTGSGLACGDRAVSAVTALSSEVGSGAPTAYLHDGDRRTSTGSPATRAGNPEALNTQDLTSPASYPRRRPLEETPGCLAPAPWPSPSATERFTGSVDAESAGHAGPPPNDESGAHADVGGRRRLALGRAVPCTKHQRETQRTIPEPGCSQSEIRPVTRHSRPVPPAVARGPRRIIDQWPVRRPTRQMAIRRCSSCLVGCRWGRRGVRHRDRCRRATRASHRRP